MDEKFHNPALTEDEQSVIDLLAVAHNKAIDLPILTDSDMPDFDFHIRACQNIILSRPAFKHYADLHPERFRKEVKQDVG